jgi:hypothetical protein
MGGECQLKRTKGKRLQEHLPFFFDLAYRVKMALFVAGWLWLFEQCCQLTSQFLKVSNILRCE